jgi:hypothetical protein
MLYALYHSDVVYVWVAGSNFCCYGFFFLKPWFSYIWIEAVTVSEISKLQIRHVSLKMYSAVSTSATLMTQCGEYCEHRILDLKCSQRWL